MMIQSDLHSNMQLGFIPESEQRSDLNIMPVENRNSYVAGNVRVERDGFAMSLNPLELKRNGA